MVELIYAERGSLDASPAAHALLRHAVFQAYGIGIPKIGRAENGKPYFPERPDIHFSLSHTKTHVLVAVSDKPVGVDVETVRPVRRGVPERVCSPDEQRQFDFFELWVLKESFLKVTGNTRVDPRSVCFRREDGGIVTPDTIVRARLYGDIPGCAAAVCALGDTPPDNLVLANLGKILGKS